MPNSLFEIHSLPFCVRFMRLFVCLFGFFFAIFKDHAPIPSLFFQLEETSLGIHLFFNSCLPVSYSTWLNDEWVTGMSIPGVRVARCWTLWNFGSLSKVTMSPPVKKPRVRFFKNQYGKLINYSWGLSRILSTVLLQFCNLYL